jgi:hypothetical protein
MKKKLSIIFVFLIANSLCLRGQTNLDLLKVELSSKINSRWTIEIDTIPKGSVVKIIIISTGQYIGEATLTDRKNNTIKFWIFYCENESEIAPQISALLQNGSCVPNKKLQAREYYWKMDNYYLFTPEYPCWDDEYSKANKKQIVKLYSQQQK